MSGDIDARNQSQHADGGGATGGVADGNTDSVIAQGSSAASGGNKPKLTSHGTHNSSTRVARAPWWSKAIGGLSIIVLIAIVVYVAARGWDDKALVIGGFLLAAAALFAAAVPLFRGGDPGGASEAIGSR